MKTLYAWRIQGNFSAPIVIASDILEAIEKLEFILQPPTGFTTDISSVERLGMISEKDTQKFLA